MLVYSEMFKKIYDPLVGDKAEFTWQNCILSCNQAVLRCI